MPKNLSRKLRKTRKSIGGTKYVEILSKTVLIEQGGEATGKVFINSEGHIKITIHKKQRFPFEPIEGTTLTYYEDKTSGNMPNELIELYKSVINAIHCHNYDFNVDQHLGEELKLISKFTPMKI